MKIFNELVFCQWDLRLVPRNNMVLITNPMRILARLVLKLKVSRNNLKILCHPICNWLYNTHMFTTRTFLHDTHMSTWCNVTTYSLFCVGVCCSVLQYVAVYCSVLQCVAVCCSVLQCVAVCCSVLQHTFLQDTHMPTCAMLWGGYG